MTARPWSQLPAASGYPSGPSQSQVELARIAGAAAFFRQARDHRPSRGERVARESFAIAARVLGGGR